MASILESIQKIIIDNIRNDKAVFVFPTDISCFSWAEWAVKNTGVRAVPKERFKAWDRFKAETENDDKEGHPVPGLLRKIFVENLMSRNKKERIFKKIISPEYADNSESFTDWVCSVLPSLKSWNELYTNKYGNKVLDEEDADYKLL